ncbi:MAG: ketoacyl-ACP synthase III [Planctomycetes bacterium]|nr:ketoacyl-ACP synthase III [Planctomycetota bacterium]
MTSRVRVGIAGTGACMPSRVMTNHDFEKLVDTSDEWIQQRTGIKERRFVSENECTSDLCVTAAQRALEAAGMQASELDLVVTGTLTPDYLLPGVSCLVQDRIGAKNAGAFDCSAACTGFLTALSIGEAFVGSGRAKAVMVLGAESLSRFLDLNDRTSCIIFGDGAGAVVLRPWEQCRTGEVLRTTLGADGSGYEFIHMKGGGAKTPPTAESVARGDHFIRMRGREVFRFAVTKMADLIVQMAEGHSYEEIGLIVPHQVNARIIESAMERVGWPLDKVFINIDKYGNTSAATVPVALDEARRAGRLEPGKLVISVAFGAGLTWGGTLIRW